MYKEDEKMALMLIGLGISILSIVLQFVGDGLMAKGQEAELLKELEERYVMVPKKQKAKKKK